jgi:hypothetical protein
MPGQKCISHQVLSIRWLCIPKAIKGLQSSVEPTDYRYEYGRFSVSVSFVTISHTDSLFSSETWINPGIRSWKKHSSAWARCQEAIGGIYFDSRKPRKPLLVVSVTTCRLIPISHWHHHRSQPATSHADWKWLIQERKRNYKSHRFTLGEA